MINTVRALASKLLFKIVLDLLIRYPQGGSHMRYMALVRGFTRNDFRGGKKVLESCKLPKTNKQLFNQNYFTSQF